MVPTRNSGEHLQQQLQQKHLHLRHLQRRLRKPDSDPAAEDSPQVPQHAQGARLRVQGTLL